jgi:hypothetical protein
MFYFQAAKIVIFSIQYRFSVFFFAIFMRSVQYSAKCGKKTDVGLPLLLRGLLRNKGFFVGQKTFAVRTLTRFQTLLRFLQGLHLCRERICGGGYSGGNKKEKVVSRQPQS